MLYYLLFFLSLPRCIGEMQEWLNWLAWKAGIPQKGIRGSNPLLSAEVKELIGSISSFFNVPGFEWKDCREVLHTEVWNHLKNAIVNMLMSVFVTFFYIFNSIF